MARFKLRALQVTNLILNFFSSEKRAKKATAEGNYNF